MATTAFLKALVSEPKSICIVLGWWSDKYCEMNETGIVPIDKSKRFIEAYYWLLVATARSHAGRINGQRREEAN